MPNHAVLTCRRAIALSSDYLEGTLGTEAAELEGHLRDCGECLAYLNTYRKTRELTARFGHVEMPAAMKERLRQFLLARLGVATGLDRSRPSLSTNGP
jgi:hypothetical protein